MANFKSTTLAAITVLLRERGLTLHPGKTRITDFDHGFSFLGKRFLKDFVLDDAHTPELDGWDETLVKALPHGLVEPDASLLSRQFRNHDGDPPVPLPTRPEPQPDVARLRPLSPRQRTLHLYGKGRRLDCRDNAFIVEEAGEEIWLCGADRIDRIDIGPNARCSDDALRFALAKGTDVAFVDGRGCTLGRLDDAPGGRAELHLAQAAHIIDEGARLALARCFIAAKIANQRSVAQRWRANAQKAMQRGAPAPARLAAIRIGIEQRLERMAGLIRKAESAGSVATLLGIEGEAAKAFLQIMRLTLNGWQFGVRKRRPASDAVNAVLNWLSHLLARDIETSLRRHGLHPGFGHLHRTENGRASLVFDLIEEFRAPLVEAAALTLFNTQALRPHHFFAPPDNPEACWITPDGIAKTIAAFEDWMSRARIRHPEIAGPCNWRGAIDAQVERLVRHFEGGPGYAGYRIKA